MKVTQVVGKKCFAILLAVIYLPTCWGQAIKESSLETYREKKLEGHDREDPIQIIAFTNAPYAPLAKDWYDSLTKLGYTSHVIVATDKASLKYFANLTASAQDSKGYRLEYEPLEKFGLQAFWKLRVTYLRKKVMEGTSVLLMDTDIIVTEKIDLESLAHSQYDVYHSYGTTFPLDAYRKQGFVFCGCFGVYKATPSTLNLLNRVLEYPGKILFDDQKMLNRVYTETLQMKWQPNVREQVEREGKSQVTGLKVKVFGKEVVLRYKTGKPCPFIRNVDSERKLPAVVMPTALSTSKMKIDVLKRFRQECLETD